MKIKEGDIVFVDCGKNAALGGYKSFCDSLPYFHTDGADEYMMSGGLFRVIQTGHSSGFAKIKPLRMQLIEEYDDIEHDKGIAFVFDESLCSA